MAQLASASGLGPEGPVFESQYPDKKGNYRLIVAFFLYNFGSPVIVCPGIVVFYGQMSLRE